jgi:hypothetical protein
MTTFTTKKVGVIAGLLLSAGLVAGSATAASAGQYPITSPTTISISTHPTSAPKGKPFKIAGHANVKKAGLKVTISYSHSKHGSYTALAHDKTSKTGRYAANVKIKKVGTFYIKTKVGSVVTVVKIHIKK